VARRSARDGTAAAFIPPRPTLAALRRAAAGCTACDLYRRGTQTVFGEGARTARVMLVGEQPGNDEDLSGRPFVGPAGRLLDRALAEAGIRRDDASVTDVVKHFKWEPRGGQRGAAAGHVLHTLLNLVGSGILTVVAWRGGPWGFVPLEGVWALLSAAPLLAPVRR
jgi:hypothetical protein